MLLKYLGYIFIIVGSLLCLSLIVNKVYICKIKDNIKKSNYVAGIAGLLALYIIFAFIISIFIPQYYNKILMLLFALSPFIIGKFASYEKELLYTSIQFICVLLSTIYILWYNLTTSVNIL